MSRTADDKFARLKALRPAPRRIAPGERGAAVDLPTSDRLAELVGAACKRNRYGEYLAVRRWFAEPARLEAAPHALRLLAPAKPGIPSKVFEEIADLDRWLFLDTETTGLAGGTGTYAFLVGVAWWDAGGLQIEQFFMRDHSEEHAVLLALAERLAERRVLVTFNGKSFDWPLLETRFRMTRQLAPRAPRAHLDLLHPARQVWRLRLGSVRLPELERHVLSWNRGPDVSSELIPQIYFEYLRGGPPEPLAPVFRHNQMDLRGLAALAGHITGLLSAPEAAQADPLDLFGLSRLLQRRGEITRARRISEHALDLGLPAAMDGLARCELARLAKRERDYPRATALWQDLLQGSSFCRRGAPVLSPPQRAEGCPAQARAEIMGAASSAPASAGRDAPLEYSLEAYEQLAIYYEHYARIPARAAELTREALAQLRRARHAGRLEPGRSRRWQARLEHRLTRLERKPRLIL